MSRFFRYVLVGILALGMAVDPVSASRLFQRSSCCRQCRSACTKGRSACTQVCLPSCPVDEYVPFKAVESPATPPSESIVLPPVPVAAPEIIEPADSDTIAPAPIKRPAKEIVGDRYSEKDLFGPLEPQKFAAPRSSKPAATNGMALGDPITPTEEEIPSVAPMPEFVELPAEEAEAEPEAEPKPEPEPQPEVDDDDLFGQSEPMTSERVNSEKGEEEPAEQPEDTTEESEPTEPIESGEHPESYDPFGENSSSPDVDVLEQAGGLLSKADRTWIDNTATFQCQARLVRVTAQGVMLQQATGKKVDVPLARLGTADLHFVHLQITALRVVRARDAAAEKLAVAWAR